ncbi:trigger factor [Thermovibrio ammonificans]|uniref:Trigger factor n=1 Tax=Thermovibrio ammonificans (strain DSM 15698 / JCM 12110 / HB-1) TaxID=648996 RepID=E8T3S5_THEA1|nr:trigger factor [Thermovibrio ammonificans]ADU97332.1 trigger factor [Thermovibrio ammonificans HB-1]
MKYQLTQESPVIYKLTLELEQDEVQPAVNAAAKEIGKQAKIPGFRPGKAPVHVVKKFYAQEIKSALINTLLAQKIGEVIEKEGLELIGEPRLAEFDVDLKNNTAKAVVILEVKPQIELKPEDYKGIEVKVQKRAVGEKEVERVIEGLRNQAAQWKEVEREAKEGDLVELEYETAVEGIEEPQKGEVAVVLGANQLWPEVEEAVKGKKAGEEGEVEFEAPEDEKYGDVAGKKVKVKFKVKAVKEKELPEVNDEFAKRFGFESLEDMKKRILEDIEIAEETREQEEIEDQIVDALLKKVDVPVPPSMLELEIQAQAQNQLTRLAQAGFNVNQLNPQTVVEMVRPTAEKTVKVKLLLEKVAELEGIEVTEEDLEEEIKKLADAAFNGDYVLARKSLEERGLIEMIKKDILRQKALDRLVELAKIEEVEPEKEEKEGDKE